jgi:predicted dehydrogenase
MAAKSLDARSTEPILCISAGGTKRTMLRVAIIGCGKIADQHVEQVLRIPETRIVGVCDRERLMAEQLRDRFPVDREYDDPEELLATERPDVVHITTPPESHLSLAELCLKAGSHVYVEKPFTVNFAQAVQLIETAESTGRKVTVGHNVQFTHPAIAMRKLVADGFLGGPPGHMESHYGYDLGDIRYAKALLGDKNHWVRRLPGKLFHNIISHGIAKIAEFWPGNDPELITCAFVSPPLRQTGEREIADELRVILLDREHGTTAYFTFSTQTRPLLHQFRVYGPENGLLTDDDHLVLLRLRGKRYKSYLENVVPPMVYARQYLASGLDNIRQLVKRELHSDAGMKNLIAAFYSSIVAEASPPIPYREILLTASIMDKIFAAALSPPAT